MIIFFVKFFNNRTYVDDFIAGRIYANRLSSFKIAEDDSGDGRTDRFEGASGWFQPGRSRLTIDGVDITPDLAGPIVVQKNWVDKFNVFCIHAAYSGTLDLNDTSKGNVEAFRHMLKIPTGCIALGQYAVVVTNVSEFIRRVASSAEKQGFKVDCKLVSYFDPNHLHGAIRDEESVFWKREEYSYQREYRFAFQSETVRHGAAFVEVGNLSDITTCYESRDLNHRFLGGEIKICN